MRLPAGQPPLAVGAERRPGRDHPLHGRQVVGATGGLGGGQRGDDRAGEGVADEGDLGHPLPLDQAEQLVGVEPPAAEQHHRPAEHEGLDGEEQRGAVHQGRRAQVDRAASAVVELRGDPTDLGRGLGHLEPHRHVAAEGERAPQVLVPPDHPLGQARRAAGVEQQDVRAGTLDPGRGLARRHAGPRTGGRRRAGGCRRRPGRRRAAGAAGPGPPPPGRPASRGRRAPRRRRCRARGRSRRPGSGG